MYVHILNVHIHRTFTGTHETPASQAGVTLTYVPIDHNDCSDGHLLVLNGYTRGYTFYLRVTNGYKYLQPVQGHNCIMKLVRLIIEKNSEHHLLVGFNRHILVATWSIYLDT